MIALLLKVLKLSEEVRLSDLFGTFECFKKALAFESTDINNFISEAFMHRAECEQIDTFGWYPGCKLLTFSSKSSLIDKAKIVKEFKIEQRRKLPFFQRVIK